ncbi:MAG: GIY-YIG nuclease family protein [Bacteroidales bacterium]|nr:GIY-YIG nuclease family protein [Bacteroidales bacterium]
MEYYTYIIKSYKDGRFYFGQTKNLDQRLNDHNKGKSKYTKPYIPWKIYAYKVFSTRAEAMKFERMLKNLHSHEKAMGFIANHNFNIVNE